MSHSILRIASLALLTATFARAQSIQLVSVSSSGVQANQYCQDPWVSADALRVAFQSGASTLVAGDSNNSDDVFVHDETTGTTTRVSVGPGGQESNGYSGSARISADGRYVVFLSGASNLVASDTNNAVDVFVHDTQASVTTRVSVGPGGLEATGTSYAPSISADGRYVAFHSSATNLVTGDTNNSWDVFVHDRQTGVTSRVSLSNTGAQATNHCAAPSISADGRYVAFHSNATNLVTGDTNGVWDIFVRDTLLGTTRRVSVNSAGIACNGNCADASISADGSVVAFTSAATNLVGVDTNARDDIFVHYLNTGVTLRASVGAAGLEGTGASKLGRISGDGRSVAFQSQSENLDPADVNAEWDVYVRDLALATTALVSVGASGQTNGSLSMTPSISHDGRRVAFESYADDLVAGDINNTSDIFVGERVIPAPTSYCTAGTTSNGCQALISASANPSVSFASACNLTVSGVEGQKTGILFYGLSALPQSWCTPAGGSYLCVKPPTQRTFAGGSGGTTNQCNGGFTLDWNAFQQATPSPLGSPWTAGDRVYVQAWFRDPPSCRTTSLSDAVEMTYTP